MQKNTAFIGVSYATSSSGINIGCSQLFDSTGAGMRMLMRKIVNPGFMGRNNPYMKADEARAMLGALRAQYYASTASTPLKRIVIHKTTPFTKEEMLQRHGRESVPLRYNKDKRKNPVFSRVSAFVVAYSIPFPTLIVNEKSVE